MLVRRIHRLGLFPQKDADQETDEDSYPPDPNFRLAFCHLAHSVRRDFKTLCRSQVWAIWLVVQCTSIVTNNTVLHSTFIFVFALRCTIGMDVQVISRVIKTDHCRSFPLSPSNTSTTIGVIVIMAIVILSTNHHCNCCHRHGHHPTLPPPSLSSSSPLDALLQQANLTHCCRAQPTFTFDRTTLHAVAKFAKSSHNYVAFANRSCAAARKENSNQLWLPQLQLDILIGSECRCLRQSDHPQH